MTTVTENPTKEQINKAKQLIIDDLFVDFPFASQADRAGAVGALLLPFVRHHIEGPTPLHLLESSTTGTGKTLLCKLIHIAATGLLLPGCMLPQNSGEARRLITAILHEKPPLFLFDNFDYCTIHNEVLVDIGTSDVWRHHPNDDHSKTVTLPNQVLWFIAGNNPRLSPELERCCFRVRLEPKMKRPWLRTGFKHNLITQWATDNREALVHTVDTLVQAWIAAGQPKGKQTLKSFDAWAEVIGGILDVTEIEGFLAR
ncbi:MAG: hypothetical protein GY854_19325 [Deltaproteobacteria bacterium]|nr:hypothetical protein [Deltaproteobacteria bacterium]